MHQDHYKVMKKTCLLKLFIFGMTGLVDWPLEIGASVLQGTSVCDSIFWPLLVEYCCYMWTL